MDPDNKNTETKRLAQRIMELELQLQLQGNVHGVTLQDDPNEQDLLPGFEDAEPPRRRSPKGRRRSDVISDYVLSSMGDGVVGCNEKEQITLVNAAAIEIMQISPPETDSGLKVLEVPDEHSPLDKTAWFKFHDFYWSDKTTPLTVDEMPLIRAVRGETVLAQEIFIRRKGAAHGSWISVNAHPLLGPDGTLFGGVSVFRDISERKATEEIRTRLVAIIDAAPDFIATTSAGGDILYINNAGRNMLGIDPSEDVSKMRFVDLHTDDAIELLEKESLPTALKEGVWRGENTFLTRENIEIPTAQVIVVHRTPTNKVEFLSCISSDMTEKNKAREALDRRAEELVRSNAELEEFAGVVAHDLHEPLRNLSGYTELLATRYKGKLDAAADEFIDQTVAGVGRMRELIGDLLAYSRVDMERKDLATVNTEEPLHQALRNVQAAIEERQALIEHTPMPTLVANSGQLCQVFQNLIANGIKFCKNTSPHVRIGATPLNEGWVFHVEDNGVGIDPRYADRIFRIFERLHSRSEFPGTGVGLAICKKVVERHGGRIWVESVPEKGSRFLFWLPSTPPDDL